MIHLNFISQYRGLPRNIYILVMARIVNSIGFFVHPFLALFMSARLGLTEVEIGKYFLLMAITFIPSAMIGGKLADKFKRKNIYMVSMLLANLLIFSCGFLGNTIHVVYVCIAAEFFFGMIGPIISAMTMDLTTPSNRRESMSLIYLGMNLGVAIGPLFAGLLFVKYTPWLFWGDALTGLGAMIIVFLFIPDTTPTKENIEQINADETRLSEASESKSVISALLSRPVLLAFILIDILLAFSYAQTGFLLPLHAEAVFGIDQGAKYYGFMCALNGLVVVLFTAVIVVATKRFSAIINIAIASVFFAVGFAMFAFTHTLAGFMFFTFIWTTGEVLSATNMGVYIANHTPVTHRARFQSIVDVVGNAGRALGPVLIGYYLVGHTMPQSWLLIGGLCGIAAVAYMILEIVDKKGSRNGKTTDSDSDFADQ